ncbi:MAG TPA: hypothetical protein VH396_23070 [Chitinophagaceae bacterium]|jgi:hypothetical protein
MKALGILIIILLIIAAIFFFSKPTDAECIAKAKPAANARALSITPGYDNPMDEGAAGKMSPDALHVKDKFFWKEVEYTIKGETKTVGYGYLGSYHPVENKKKEGL